MEDQQTTTTETPKSGKSNAPMIAIVLIVIIAVIIGGFILFTNKKQASPAAMESSPTATGEPATPTPSKSTYKDGTYTAEGSYATHENTEKLGVTVTLAGGIVKDVSLKQEAVLQMSKFMQSDFAAHYKTMVVGKNIDDIKLGKVSGSSLTPIGFNNALDQIKTQAKS